MTVDIIKYQQRGAHLCQSAPMDPTASLGAGATHDLVNYLSVVDSYISLLLMDANPGDRLHRMLTEADNAVEKCMSLARQHLAKSRTAANRSQELCVNDVIASMEAVLRRLVGQDAKFTIACAPDVALVRADPQEIERILLNLVVNARQAITDTGTITLQTANVQVDQVDGKEVKPTDYVVIAVRDNGTGMDEETRAHLFEPFFTTRANGTGLGLAIVYDIVSRNHGRVQVESKPGRGTTVKVLLPRIRDDKMEERRSRDKGA